MKERMDTGASQRLIAVLGYGRPHCSADLSILPKRNHRECRAARPSGMGKALLPRAATGPTVQFGVPLSLISGNTMVGTALCTTSRLFVWGVVD
jgi:hypothetical protein